MAKENLTYSEILNEDSHLKKELRFPITSIYRGIYANSLKNGDLLPVGGKMFVSPVLDINLKLDFDSFEEETSKYTEEFFRKKFEEVEPLVRNWLETAKMEIDPYTFFVSQSIQRKVEALLKVKHGSSDETDELLSKRAQSYRTDDSSPTKLSETVGHSACSERAVLGQYLLQKVGIPSSYMGGIRMDNAKDDESFPEEHSVIVVHKTDADYIFDIARPHITSGKEAETVPRIMKTAVRLNPELFSQIDGKEHEDLLIECREVWKGQQKEGQSEYKSSYFGVGIPVAGTKEIVSFE